MGPVQIVPADDLPGLGRDVLAAAAAADLAAGHFQRGAAGKYHPAALLFQPGRGGSQLFLVPFPAALYHQNGAGQQLLPVLPPGKG